MKLRIDRKRVDMEYELNIRDLELNLGVRHNIFIIIKIQHLQHFHGAFFKRILFFKIYNDIVFSWFIKSKIF